MGVIQRFKSAYKAFTFGPSNWRKEVWQQIIWDGGFMPIDLANNSNSQIIHGYSQNIDVYSIIRKIVDILKSTPWVIEKQQASGVWKELKNTPINTVMDAPNKTKEYTWDDIEEMIIIYLIVTGNAYVKGTKAIGFDGILELDILPSNGITIYNINTDFFVPKLQYYFNFGSTSRVYTKEDLKHIKYFNPNLITYQYGLSPLQVAANAIQVGNERWIADASILGNKGISGMVGDKSALPLLPEEADKVDEALRKRIGGAHKFGQVLVTNKDLTYIPLGLSPADLQLLEKGKVTTRALCNILGLDSSLFNDPDNKTYNNRLEAEKAMYTNCIIPLSGKISEALSQYICPTFYPDQVVRMRQDFSQVECLQGSRKEESEVRKNEVYAILNQFHGGFITYNNGLEVLGESKVEGMDLYYWQMDDTMRSKFDFSNLRNSQQVNN